ncbi:MAG: hypothetical protein WCC17_14135 [Candidatus Nitrosopolaris sp.]
MMLGYWVYSNPSPRQKKDLSKSRRRRQHIRFAGGQQIDHYKILSMVPGSSPEQIINAWEWRSALYNPYKSTDSEDKEWAWSRIREGNEALLALTATKDSARFGRIGTGSVTGPMDEGGLT